MAGRTRDQKHLHPGASQTGVTVAQAEAGVNGIARQLADEYPKEDSGMKIMLTPPGLIDIRYARLANQDYGT
jgi:hypothetical protein